MEVHGLEEDVTEGIETGEVIEGLLFRHEEAIEVFPLHEGEGAIASFLEFLHGKMEGLLERLRLLGKNHCDGTIECREVGKEKGRVLREEQSLAVETCWSSPDSFIICQ